MGLLALKNKDYKKRDDLLNTADKMEEYRTKLRDERMVKYQALDIAKVETMKRLK
ncbi:MAG: hypothetical protein RBU23_12040 [Candidatus Auribacterota bacterium]|jgi:hypothetical protein|nr:hypothetical protein [Candidatus Auribacterota bacterium]